MAVLFVNLYLEEKDPMLLDLSKKYCDYCIKNIGKIKLTGLAHGYAGICLAIAGYYDICKERKYLSFVEELIEIENQHYDERKANWRDLRNQDKDEILFIGVMELGNRNF